VVLREERRGPLGFLYLYVGAGGLVQARAVEICCLFLGFLLFLLILFGWFGPELGACLFVRVFLP
jgi:fumarate reductase subunit D